MRLDEEQGGEIESASGGEHEEEGTERWGVFATRLPAIVRGLVCLCVCVCLCGRGYVCLKSTEGTMTGAT